jgi:hypothetical protein
LVALRKSKRAKVPNAKSRLAMKELAEGRGKRSASPAALFKDLGI